MKSTIFSTIILAVLLLVVLPKPTQAQSISITNKTGMAVTAVYISPSGQDSWHLIRTTKNGLTKDETFQFYKRLNKTYCAYDLKFRCEDTNFYYMRNLDMCIESSFDLVLPDNTKDK